MDRWKSRGGKSQRGEEKKREDPRRERARRKRCRCGKSRNIAIHCVFSSDLWLRGGLRSRLAKAAGAEPSGQMREKKMLGSKHISKTNV